MLFRRFATVTRGRIGIQYGRLLVPRATQQCRLYATKPSWVNRWLIKSPSTGGTWEETEVESTEVWDQTARRLKEDLIRAKNTKNVDSKGIQALLSMLVEQSPDNRINPKYLPIVEVAYSMMIDSGLKLSLEYCEKLFHAVASNPADEIMRFSVITKLYSVIYKHGNVLYNAVLYAKFLRIQGKIEESQKLLNTSFKQNQHLVNDEVVKFCIDAIKSTNSDGQSLSKILTVAKDTKCDLSLEVYHEAIIAFSETVAKERDSSDKFSLFVNKFVLKNDAFPSYSEETVVIILDACLALNATKTGNKVVTNMGLSVLESFQPKNREMLLQFYELLLMSCSRFRVDIHVGKEVVDKLYANFDEKDFAKETWDVIIQWKAYESPKIDEIKGLIGRMEFVPDQATLNGVLRMACENLHHDNAYVKSVLDYFNKELEVDSDVETFSLLLQRCLEEKDLDTAEKMFEKSLSEGCQWSSQDGKFLKTLDELLVNMCNMPPPVDTYRVFRVFQKVKMFTDTVGYDAQVAILKMFLDGDFVPDAGRFLEDELGGDKRDSTRNDLPYYKVPEMYEAMYDYIMTREDYKNCWLLYGYLNRFIKLPYESYFPTMKRFCDLQRPDAALLIFKYLRARNKKEGMRPPSEAMYILLFNEFGRMLYEEGVKTLHLFFKMDLSIDTNINLQNSLMSAYCNLEEDEKVMELWSQTETFPAINNDTATIMIKQLTRSSTIHDVEDFWLSLPETYNLTPTSDNLRQYIVANCYHGYYMRALKITKEASEVYGIEPTQDIIEALYNWSLLPSRKAQVEQWALENHSDKWHALQQKGTLKSYVLPENNDNNSEEALRAEAISLLEGERTQHNKYVPELPDN
ncbi:hypothetical protein TRICI_003610 [Trichomonascus ciferrii]|uniref:Mitochondrial group I intron splicing factor CCM1 n=1 Tax=Trichomonascus ciferrii TaxID=44093 RepID=A0A642V3J0_9ASCO|nr:hypothetical protein TRICI_003610 [Trichomonascus ciferrii]